MYIIVYYIWNNIEHWNNIANASLSVEITESNGLLGGVSKYRAAARYNYGLYTLLSFQYMH